MECQSGLIVVQKLAGTLEDSSRPSSPDSLRLLSTIVFLDTCSRASTALVCTLRGRPPTILTTSTTSSQKFSLGLRVCKYRAVMSVRSLLYSDTDELSRKGRVKLGNTKPQSRTAAAAQLSSSS